MPKFSKKGGSSKSKDGASGGGGDSANDKRFQISNTRFVSVGLFRNKVRVDIREYYLDDQGEKRPGKKGISLSLEEYKKLKDCMDDIDKTIKKIDEVPTDDSDESE